MLCNLHYTLFVGAHSLAMKKLLCRQVVVDEHSTESKRLHSDAWIYLLGKLVGLMVR